MTTAPRAATTSFATGNAHLAATLSEIEEIFGSMLGLLRSIDDAEANWHPPVADTNSIAAMVRHTVGATALWLGRAVGEEIKRDRDAEFKARETAADLVSAAEGAIHNARDRFAQLASVDPTTVRHTNFRGGPADLSVAWCLAHALDHVGEHWGQLQLTHQWYGVRAAG